MDAQETSRIVQRLQGRGSVLLRPVQVFDESLTARIQALEGDPLDRRSKAEVRAVMAGLHLWNDDLAWSHELCQDLDTATGSYWHGILHRREGDDSNARYWFRRAGDHPAHPFVQHHARTLAQAHPDHPAARRLLASRTWDPFAFVEECSGGEDPLLQAIQVKEMELLVRHSREALGQG